MRSRTDLDIRVFYLWDFGVRRTHDPGFGKDIAWDTDLLSGYDSEFVPNTARHPGAEHFFGFKNPEVIRRLESWKPDALLLFGYKWATHLRVAFWARTKGIPLIFRGDSHLIGRERVPPAMRLALGLIFKQFSAFLHVGAANKEYFRAFGVPESKLFFAPHSVDASLFDPSLPAHRAATEMLKSQLGLQPESRIVLYAGKLVDAKQPLELLEAFGSLNPKGAALVFVGDGELLGRLQSRAKELSTAAGAAPVRFLPFANQSEMPSRYLLAEVFVLPSKGLYETWGLAVNEAMHMGIPCLVSTRVGCQRDLVIDNETGWVFDPLGGDNLKLTLARALSDVSSPDRRAALRAEVERRVSRYTYAATTRGLRDALEFIQR